MFQISCAGLLFDLDGVLIDSTPAVARVWTKWAIAHGFDPAETVRCAHGRPSIATIRDLLPNADAAEENDVVHTLVPRDESDKREQERDKKSRPVAGFPTKGEKCRD